MSYTVSKSNSCFFQLDGEKYALSCNPEDDMGYWEVGIFKMMPNGAWNAIPPLIKDGLTTAEVMAHGSVAGYLAYLLPIASQRAQALAVIPKPPQADKPACVGYDLALDVVFDAETKTFRLNKSPPLSHAR